MTLQPLGVVPFRLEYDFEFRILQQEQQRHLVTYMLDKHTLYTPHDLGMLSSGVDMRAVPHSRPHTSAGNYDR